MGRMKGVRERGTIKHEFLSSFVPRISHLQFSITCSEKLGVHGVCFRM